LTSLGRRCFAHSPSWFDPDRRLTAVGKAKAADKGEKKETAAAK